MHVKSVALDCHEEGPPLVTRSACHQGARSKEARSNVARRTRSQSKAKSTSACSPIRASTSTSSPPARRRLAEDPRPPDRRGPREPVCAAIESMTGARLRPRHARAAGLGRSRSQTPRRSRASPRSPARPTRSTRWCWRCLAARPGAGDLAARSPGPRGARARPLPPPSGQAPLDAQAPHPLDPDQLRPTVPGHRPVRGRGPQAARRASRFPSPGGATSPPRVALIDDLDRQIDGDQPQGSRPATPTTPTSRC